MTNRKHGLCAALLSIPLCAAQPPSTAELSADQKRAAIGRVCELLEQRYVFPEIAERIVARLRESNYDRATTREAFAEALTADLRAINDDRHLMVWEVPERTDGAPATRYDYTPTHGRPANFGMAHVEVFAGNLGYLRLANFSMDEDYEQARLAVDRAMGFVSDTDALIFDLRGNPGGGARLVRYLASYLYSAEPVLLNTFYLRHRDRMLEYWTLPEVGGARRPETPVFILIDRRTFSAGEGFAYQLKHLGRAKVLGEPSGGGSHGGASHVIGDRLEVFIPHSRSIHPVTQTDYEGTGVQPDVRAEPWSCLRLARIAALERLTEAEQAAAFQIEELARLRAVQAEHAAIAECVGNYLEGGSSGSFDRLARAFHPDATMQSVGGDGRRRAYNAVEFFRPRIRGGSDRRTRITAIDVEGSIARARLEIDYETFRFVDFANLMRVDGRWVIVDKTYVRVSK